MMSPMLSREGRVTCQNKHHRRRVGNLELEILECQPIKTSQEQSKTLAQQLEGRGLGAHGNVQSHWLRKLRKRAKSFENIYNRTPKKKLFKNLAMSFGKA